MNKVKARKKSVKKKRAALPIYKSADDLPAVLRAEEVAGFLRVSLSKIYLEVENDTIPHWRIGGAPKGAIRFDKDKVLAWREGARDGQ